MATLKERDEYEKLAEELKQIRKKCELHGKIFKKHISNDSALKIKVSRFKSLSVKIKEQKKNELKLKSIINKKKENEENEEEINGLITRRKRRKRRYSECNKYDENDINDWNPRKKLKNKHGSFRNNVGFSPSISFNVHEANKLNKQNNINNDIEDKENIYSSFKQQRKRRISMPNPFGNVSFNKLNIETPSKNIKINNERNKGLLSSNQSSLKNRMYLKKTQQNTENIENHNESSNDNDNNNNDENKNDLDDINDITKDENDDKLMMNDNNNNDDDDDDDDDDNDDNDDYVPLSVQTPINRNNNRKNKKRSTKTKKKAVIPQTVKPKKRKITKRTIKKKSVKCATTKKYQSTKRKTKKDGAGVSSNFVKMDLKHTSYRRKKRGNNKKSRFKFDKFGNIRKDGNYWDWKEEERRKRIEINNLNLENTKQLKNEINSESDNDQDIDIEIEEKQKEKEDIINPYYQRLNNMNNNDNDNDNDDEMDNLLMDILHSEYGYNGYRMGQKEAIKLILQQQSVLLLLSTGGGKSICYQIPTILWKNNNLNPVTLVISPLISLMYDQCNNLPNCLNGAVWNSSLKKEEIWRLREDVINGKINILYIAPEKLDNNYFRSFLRNSIGSKRLMFACIDEAHCISEWSHNFRPSYLKLKRLLIDYLGIKCILSCTATATVITQNSIINNLNINKKNIISCLQRRNNLNLTVSHIGNGVNKQEKLIKLLQTQRFENLQSLIIYATTKNEVDEVTMKLNHRLKRRDFNINIEAYHAGKSHYVREDVQNRFMNGNINIIVATIAFGMGLNKRNVRGVIHYSMPKTMEHYVQEIGRAGRDGLGSQCHVFYDRMDIKRHKSWIYMNGIDLIQIKRILFDIFSAKNVKILRRNLKKNKQKKMKKIYQNNNKKRKKMEEYDFSDDEYDENGDGEEEDDENENELILTEFKGINDIVAIPKCPETEKKYDAFNVVLSTIFTYLDVYKNEYIKQLPSHYDKMKIGITKNIKELEKNSEIIRFIMNFYKPNNGIYIVHLVKLYNDLRNFQIEDENGEIINIEKEYNVYEIQRHLKNLQFNNKISLHFDNECFVLMIKKNINDHQELVNLCQNIYEYISKHEISELEKINTLAQALKIIANNNGNDNVDIDIDGVKKTNISLHELVDEYFKCENHDEFLDLIQSYLPYYDHIRTQPVSKNNIIYNEIKESIEIFMAENPEIKRVRSIAKIFHGFRSPLFPTKAWSNNTFWRKYTSFPFMQIIQIAKDIIIEKKNKKNNIKNNDNNNNNNNT